LIVIAKAVHEKALLSVFKQSTFDHLARVRIGPRSISRGLFSGDTGRAEAMEKGGDMGGSAANNSSDFVSPPWWLDPDF
jgi:hypothetical protein